MSAPRWLLLHGVPTAGRYWSRLRLPGEVHAPDLPGFGARPDRVPSALWGFADDVAHLAGPDVTVVGVDFGGVIAAVLAARGLAGRLVLMSTALGAAWWPSRLASYPPFAAPFYRWSAGRRFLQAADPTGSLAAAFPPADGLADRMIRIARQLDVGELHRIRGRAAGRAIPKLCLWGDADPFLPPRLGRRLAGQLGATSLTMPGRHAVAWTHPDEVSTLLRAW